MQQVTDMVNIDDGDKLNAIPWDNGLSSYAFILQL